MRFAATLTAVVCAMGMAVYAQDSTVKTKTETKGETGKMVTYTGCVKTGTEAQSFVLDKVVPVGQTTEVGTSGNVTTSTTTTTYMLVPGEKVTFQQFVGHKVEVTGMMIPGGDSKTTTRTKVEREGGPDSNTKETTKSDNAMPQFRVTSVKHLADSCQ
jgi:hypothetical protein